MLRNILLLSTVRFLGSRARSGSRGLPSAAAIVALLLAAAAGELFSADAMAQEAGGGETVLLIVLDRSSSMEEEVGGKHKIDIMWMEIEKKVKEFLIEKGTTENLKLIVIPFNQRAFGPEIVHGDYDRMMKGIELLKSKYPPSGRTDIAAAIDKASEWLAAEKEKKAPAFLQVIVVTDGDQTVARGGRTPKQLVEDAIKAFEERHKEFTRGIVPSSLTILTWSRISFNTGSFQVVDPQTAAKLDSLNLALDPPGPAALAGDTIKLKGRIAVAGSDVREVTVRLFTDPASAAGKEITVRFQAGKGAVSEEFEIAVPRSALPADCTSFRIGAEVAGCKAQGNRQVWNNTTRKYSDPIVLKTEPAVLIVRPEGGNFRERFADMVSGEAREEIIRLKWNAEAAAVEIIPRGSEEPGVSCSFEFPGGAVMETGKPFRLKDIFGAGAAEGEIKAKVLCPKGRAPADVTLLRLLSGDRVLARVDARVGAKARKVIEVVRPAGGSFGGTFAAMDAGVERSADVELRWNAEAGDEELKLAGPEGLPLKVRLIAPGGQDLDPGATFTLGKTFGADAGSGGFKLAVLGTGGIEAKGAVLLRMTSPDREWVRLTGDIGIKVAGVLVEQLASKISYNPGETGSFEVLSIVPKSGMEDRTVRVRIAGSAPEGTALAIGGRVIPPGEPWKVTGPTKIALVLPPNLSGAGEIRLECPIEPREGVLVERKGGVSDALEAKIAYAPIPKLAAKILDERGRPLDRESELKVPVGGRRKVRLTLDAGKAAAGRDVAHPFAGAPKIAVGDGIATVAAESADWKLDASGARTVDLVISGGSRAGRSEGPTELKFSVATEEGKVEASAWLPAVRTYHRVLPRKAVNDSARIRAFMPEDVAVVSISLDAEEKGVKAVLSVPPHSNAWLKAGDRVVGRAVENHDGAEPSRAELRLTREELGIGADGRGTLTLVQEVSQDYLDKQLDLQPEVSIEPLEP
ncbi:MAG: VWA domain-containing protein [Planctomycetota bacterium]|nr:VWA domain-containing protein [Planctomycetota bacterium]